MIDVMFHCPGCGFGRQLSLVEDPADPDSGISFSCSCGARLTIETAVDRLIVKSAIPLETALLPA